MEVPMPKRPEKMLKGVWSENLSWEFYQNRELPPPELCSAVFCVALHNDQLVLTRTKRGWELLGGHLEPGETIYDALHREAHEEGGFTPQRLALFGYKKIYSKQPVPGRLPGTFYPHPVGYLPFFVADSTLPLEPPHGDEGEILESRSFPLDQLPWLKDYEIVQLGLEAHGWLL